MNSGVERAINHYMTSVCTFNTLEKGNNGSWANSMPGLNNVSFDPKVGHRNKDGFSFSTMKTVLTVACPGGDTFTEQGIPQCSAPNSQVWSLAAMKNHHRLLHYAEAEAEAAGGGSSRGGLGGTCGAGAGC